MDVKEDSAGEQKITCLGWFMSPFALWSMLNAYPKQCIMQWKVNIFENSNTHSNNLLQNEFKKHLMFWKCVRIKKINLCRRFILSWHSDDHMDSSPPLSSYLHWLKNLDLIDLGKVTIFPKSLYSLLKGKTLLSTCVVPQSLGLTVALTLHG